MIEPRILVLLAARLRSRASASAIRDTYLSLGGTAEEVGDFESLLAAAEALGQVRVRGEESRRSLTDAGQAELAAHLAADAAQAGRADLVTSYEAFLPLNREFLAVLSGSPDAEDLAALVARLGPILDALESQRGRFGGYAGRFSDALVKARQDPEWIAGPSVDSIHTIWFELHEHLLATLGRDRTQEPLAE